LLIFSLNLLLNPNMTKIRSVAIIFAQTKPSSGFSGYGPTDTLTIAAVVGLILGGLLLIISVLSIIGLICIRLRYHGCFFCFGPVLLILLLLILVSFMIFVLVTGDTELQRLASSTQETVYYFYNSTTSVRNGWDFVQYYFSCCGVKNNNTDWLPAPITGWRYYSTLPRSCCGYDPKDAGHAGRIFLGNDVPTLVGFCYFGDISQVTCYESIKTNLLIAVLVFLGALVLIVLILAILSMIILCRYRKIRQHWDYPRVRR
jgi:energy-coupling factor transporter transmembrane protein EcfT